MNFIPASNEPSGCACTSIRRLPRGSNTPQLSCVTSLMPRQLAAGYLTDKAFADKLTGDDFLQAMAEIYSEPEVRKTLGQYPAFVSDVITVIDYDTALQMD